jgi:hypothetical protein
VDLTEYYGGTERTRRFSGLVDEDEQTKNGGENLRRRERQRGREREKK